ncbi:hypothetical protein NG99_22230 [Erwinia typographi]|uniref:Antitoxin Xre/MbcA/ParS-like toxin-binding domain-containing protein n=1 Tax=Erwinia typographi TaxID=371042 RepID=A0A0A3YPD4_9GAMM|nr:hypothetical protein [Erwinia typographi]KGT88475.1 hypothetical protein NG99_22230 [Erwinia typographi]
MEMLERYYSGEKDWNDFALSFSEFKDLDQVVELAGLLNGNIDVATVIWGKVGSVGAKDWIYKKVNALDKVRPIDCTEDKNLLNRLRVALMRMPC